jgi:2,5-diketo-D-gluconate reductase A
MSATPQPLVTLSDGVTIPAVGFGVFQIPAGETERAVAQALQAGYRHIDTAAVYGNEEAVGRAIRSSGLPRQDVFVTTKLWNADHGERAGEGIRASLDRLGLERVDLLLIHWPVPSRGLFVTTWETLIEARAVGLTRSIGVSNFTDAHVEALAPTGVVPSMNQVELHPYLGQAGLLERMRDRGVAVTAWSPLAKSEVLADPVVRGVAHELGVTPAQAVLRWHLQRGAVVIPKSTSIERMRSNRDLFSFSLDARQLAALEGLDRGYRTGPDPDGFDEL